MRFSRFGLALAGIALALAIPFGSIGAAQATSHVPANVTGKVCATADTNLCIGAPGISIGGRVYSTDAAHARTFGFTGPGATSVIYFTSFSGLCLGASYSTSDNVTIQNTSGTAGVDFEWINASGGGHYFYNPHKNLYLGVTGPDGSTVAVVPKGQFGWDLRFNGP